MKVQLRRYQLPVPHEGLADVLRESTTYPSESMGADVDLTDVFAVLDELRANANASDTGSGSRSSWDARLCEPLHDALDPVLTTRDAADPRMWHWLTTATRLREFVWLRWHGLVPGAIEDALSSGDLPSRFLGSGSLVGLARNALGRLYWTVETLSDGSDDGPELARTALKNTDLHLNLFERMVGLHPPAARAAVRVLDERHEDEHRRALKRLNRLATTMDLELMSEEDVALVLTEALD